MSVALSVRQALEVEVPAQAKRDYLRAVGKPVVVERTDGQIRGGELVALAEGKGWKLMTGARGKPFGGSWDAIESLTVVKSDK